MVNIVEFLEPNTLKHNLDKKVEREFPRGYPGMSGTGEECLRKQQFEHYFVAKGELQARTLRIFAIGHLFEEVFYKEAREIGCKIYGDQQDLVLLNGKLSGHCDGIIEGIPESPKTPHVLELKSLNNKSFNETKKKGVKESKPLYYAQVQQYMKALKLKRAMFVAINKDTCEYYMERIHYDGAYTKELLNKKLDVFESEMLLPRISDKKNFYKCGWCTYKDICHDNAPIEKTCRTCIASEYKTGMDWNCWKHDKILNRDEQIESCKDYNIIEMFMPNGTL